MRRRRPSFPWQRSLHVLLCAMYTTSWAFHTYQIYSFKMHYKHSLNIIRFHLSTARSLSLPPRAQRKTLPDRLDQTVISVGRVQSILSQFKYLLMCLEHLADDVKGLPGEDVFFLLVAKLTHNYMHSYRHPFPA